MWEQDFLLSHGHSLLANQWINLKAFLKELICLWSQIETNSLYFPVCSYNYSRNKDWNWFPPPFTSSHDSFSVWHQSFISREDMPLFWLQSQWLEYSRQNELVFWFLSNKKFLHRDSTQLNWLYISRLEILFQSALSRQLFWGIFLLTDFGCLFQDMMTFRLEVPTGLHLLWKDNELRYRHI